MALLNKTILLCLLLIISISTSTATNLAYNKTTYAISDNGAGYTPNKSTDNNFSTSWVSNITQTYPAWIMVDLGANYSITSFRLSYPSSYQYNINLTVSTDNTTYTEIYSNASYYTGIGASLLPNTEITTTQARYVKLWLVDNIDAEVALLKEFQIYDYVPELIYPVNESSLSKSYPPLTESINFTWSLESTFSSNLVIAKDINFNIIAVDTTTSNNYSSHAIEAGNYWWKVRYYNATSETYYNYSSVSNFTLTNTITATGTGVDGIVYELIGTTQTPLSGATVYLYNSTLSQTTTTGSNGYYLFDGLGNSTTYNIYVWKKDFDSSPTMPITTGNGTITTKNIEIKRTQPLLFDADKQYVLLKARWLYCISSCDIAGATISVYNSGESTPYATGTTDSTGSISFLLYKTQLYRITIVKASEGVNKEETLYPKDNSYIFLITNSPISWRNHTIEQKDAITISVTKNIINSTHTYINVSYNDSLAETTALGIGISNNNTSVGSWSGSGNTSQSFIISNYSGKSYLVSINGTHTTYGSLSETYSVFFEKSSVGITGIPEALWLWFMIGIMFFTAAVFTASTAEIGLIIVSAEGWIGLSLGAFSTINTTQFGIGLSLVTILGVLAYIKKQQAKEGMV